MVESKRNKLAEKMEIIGQVFEIDGMSDLLNKFDKNMNQVKFSAVIIQISGLLLKNNKTLADKIIGISKDITEEKVQEMEDSVYATALKDAIITDVMGFFASSPSSDGQK